MLVLSRSLFAVLLAVLIGVFTVFHFHGTVFSAASAITRQARVANEQISPNAPNNHYTLAVRRKSTPDVIPALPDISGFTVDKIAAQAPAFAPGKIEIAG